MAQLTTEREACMRTQASEQAFLMKLTYEEIQRRGVANTQQSAEQVQTGLMNGGAGAATAVASASIFGSVSEFNLNRDNWTVWVERLEQYFKADDIPEGKKNSYHIDDDWKWELWTSKEFTYATTAK
ncbi:hypothetical protein QAD02_002153 [Eretmocerus hayati]|uniref:Uncharacterized protein n=1 Tax=Eretmocerus hayati TaxID=131215 RepID=A0ACC2NKQ7_9HYME|nr:hypothetical protein QAD02_002153 [Eretmocerus hayati]